MTDPDEEPSREEAIYAFVVGFLNRHGFEIALIAPFVVIFLVPPGPVRVTDQRQGMGLVLLVLVIYLGEAIVYAAIQRKRRGVPSGRGSRSGPGPVLQALWSVLAVLLIIGGLIGRSTSDESTPFAAIVALSLGIAIVAWLWVRVARASGESTLIFAARIAGTIGRTGASVAGTLVVRLILVAVVALLASRC